MPATTIQPRHTMTRHQRLALMRLLLAQPLLTEEEARRELGIPPDPKMTKPPNPDTGIDGTNGDTAHSYSHHWEDDCPF